MVKTYDIVTAIEMIEDVKNKINSGIDENDIIKSLIRDGADNYDVHVMIKYIKYLNHINTIK